MKQIINNNNLKPPIPWWDATRVDLFISLNDNRLLSIFKKCIILKLTTKVTSLIFDLQLDKRFFFVSSLTSQSHERWRYTCNNMLLWSHFSDGLSSFYFYYYLNRWFAMHRPQSLTVVDSQTVFVFHVCKLSELCPSSFCFDFTLRKTLFMIFGVWLTLAFLYIWNMIAPEMYSNMVYRTEHAKPEYA